MPTTKKTTTKKETKPTTKKTSVAKSAEKVKYYEGVGRRKSSTARARLYLSGNKAATITINNKPYKEYLQILTLRRAIEEPLSKLKLKDKFSVSIIASGGGISGQIGAAVLGVSRALVKYDETLKPMLKLYKLLTSDARVKERKHVGKRGARRGQQWSKR